MTEAERERAAIVAWLRKLAREELHVPGAIPAALARLINAYARFIEQGAHLNVPVDDLEGGQ